MIMEKKKFVHLHLHSHFSIGKGIEPVESLVNKAHQLQMPAIAITVHNSLAGAVNFYSFLPGKRNSAEFLALK